MHAPRNEQRAARREPQQHATWLSIVLGILVLGLALAPVALGEQPDPEPLWDAYPLEEAPPDSAGGDADAPPESAVTPEATAAPEASATPEPSATAAPPASAGEQPAVAASEPTDLTVPLVLLLLAAMAVVSTEAVLRTRRALRAGAPETGAAGSGAERVRAFTEPVPPGSTVLGYVSLGGVEPEAANRHDLVIQEALIRETCAERGWQLRAVACDDQRTLAAPGRPGLASAVERAERGEAAALVVSGVDRLGGSAGERGDVLRALAEAQVALVTLDHAGEPPAARRRGRAAGDRRPVREPRSDLQPEEQDAR